MIQPSAPRDGASSTRGKPAGCSSPSSMTSSRRTGTGGRYRHRSPSNRTNSVPSRISTTVPQYASRGDFRVIRTREPKAIRPESVILPAISGLAWQDFISRCSSRATATQLKLDVWSVVEVDHFYRIEIGEFPARIAATTVPVAKPRAPNRPVNTRSFIRCLRDTRGYAARRNSSSRRTVSSGRSCCTQWPAPSSRCAPRKSVQALSCIRSNAPGR